MDKNLKKLEVIGKLSEIIGKIIFYTIFSFITIFTTIKIFTSVESNTEIFQRKSTEIERKYWWMDTGSGMIGGVIGSLVFLVLFFLLSRLFFRYVYRLNTYYNQYLNEEIYFSEFKKKRNLSLIFSIILGIIPIYGTFGMSFLIMIPQYLFLFKLSRKDVELSRKDSDFKNHVQSSTGVIKGKIKSGFIWRIILGLLGFLIVALIVLKIQENKELKLENDLNFKQRDSINTIDGKVYLPSVSGLRNGYKSFVVKNFLNVFENDDSKIYAFYIQDNSFLEIQKVYDESDLNARPKLDEYWYLYQTNNLKNIEVTDDIKEKIDKSITNNYVKYENKNNRIYYSGAFEEIDYNKTYLAEKIKNLKTNNISYVLINKTSSEYSELKLITILTPIEIKKKIYFISYNRKFNSIAIDLDAKLRADYINAQIYEMN